MYYQKIFFLQQPECNIFKTFDQEKKTEVAFYYVLLQPETYFAELVRNMFYTSLYKLVLAK